MSKDPSFPSISSCASQEGHEDKSGQAPTRKLKVTLLSSEWQSTKGGLSTIIRELAIQLAKHQNVEVSMYLPQCSEEDVRIAEGYHVKLVQARKLIGYEPSEWLSFAPENHEMDYVIGHGLILGRQVQLIQKQLKCKWVQVLHTAPEDLGMFKGYEYAISRAEEKTEAEIKLCELADKVVALGPKLADDYSRYLRHCQGDESVFALTPSIFSEFSPIKHAAEERMTFCVLVFGRGDTEDFELKGYDIAAKAISELKEESYQLIFVGAPLGREEEVAEKLCQRGIARRHLTVCSFKESRKDLNRLFCEVDLCIMPSRTEGFGLAALEALSAGLPILVSGNSGLGNALQNVPHGSSRVVNSEDPKEWAKAIKRVSEKKRDVRLEETQDLRTQYAKKYCWKEQCDKLLKMMFDSAFGTHHATEVEQDSSLSRKGKRPLNPSVTPLSKKQRHDTAAVADSEVVKLLREVYMRQAVFRPLLWNKEMKLHLHEVYTRLKIVLRPKGDGPSGGSEVDLSNIFGCNTGEDSMALAEGSPGIGKTTLCLKLAYDWANESMPSTFPVFELVLLLKCRDLDGDMMEAIFEQLLPEDTEENTKKRLRNFITDIHSQERILIILDGLDELPERSKHHLDKLLDRRVLPFCYVLATTRQEKGIQARERFEFDICLQIEGFSEEDSFGYIRKYFKCVDPSKGERLVEEIRENTFLHALQNNPLNLSLLCVVYQDHEGKLPSSRTNLYQIIVQCLLKRYCEKNSVKACEEDRDLEKQFEADILVLGELAWKCLLNDRHSFREDELKEFERSDEICVVRYLGLVYKEESLKRLKPQHEYFFLHKSFQEYMAASYIAHKLRSNQFNVFEHVHFNQVVRKFPQVFLFVCGILREEAIILFTQIGEKLKSKWTWLKCRRAAATFFVEGFSESGNPERMADALFSFIPFPRVVHLSLCVLCAELDIPGDCYLVKVLRACASFSKVQKPELHLKMSSCENVLQLQSLPKVKNLDISFDGPYFDWDSVAEYLKASETLEKLTFPLWNESREGWARTLDAVLCGDTPLSSVGLRIHGSLSQTAIKAFENLLHNKSLSSFSIYICGDMQDTLAVALATGLAGPIAVKVLHLCVEGKLSLFGANFIERGIVENNSLIELSVSLRGEVPDNWQMVGRNIHSRLRRETSSSYALYPNTFGKVTSTQMTQCCPFFITDGLLVQQNVTLNVWGELGGDDVEALFEGLSRSPVSHLTLDIHGKLTDDILNSTARWVEERNAQSSLTINIWEQLTKEEKDLFEELKLDKNPAVTHNVRDVPAPPEESRDDEFVSIHDLESFIALFKEAKNTGKQNLSATIRIESSGDTYFDHEADEMKDSFQHVLVNNATLNTLSLTFIDHESMCYSWAVLLGVGLALNTSLKNLTLAIRCLATSNSILEYLPIGSRKTWEVALGMGLERNKSLKNLTLIIEILSDVCEEDGLCIAWPRNPSVENLMLTINNHSCVRKVSLDGVFKRKKSLKNLTLTINNFGSLNLDWENYGLENKSLNDFSLTINNYGNISSKVSGIPGFLSRFKFLSTFNLTLNLCYKGDIDYLYCLLEEAMNSESLETLRLKVNDRQIANDSCGYDFSKFVVRSPSLSLIEVTVSFYGVEETQESETWNVNAVMTLGKQK